MARELLAWMWAMGHAHPPCHRRETAAAWSWPRAAPRVSRSGATRHRQRRRPGWGHPRARAAVQPASALARGRHPTAAARSGGSPPTEMTQLHRRFFLAPPLPLHDGDHTACQPKQVATHSCRRPTSHATSITSAINVWINGVHDRGRAQELTSSSSPSTSRPARFAPSHPAQQPQVKSVSSQRRSRSSIDNVLKNSIPSPSDTSNRLRSHVFPSYFDLCPTRLSS